MPNLTPNYELLQSIYDISNEFFELFLGPTMGYTCGYFERDGMITDEAQNAKFDLALSKLNLQPGMTLLDVGCGWGGGMQRAIETYDVNVIGLTLSARQREYAEAKLAKVAANVAPKRRVEVRLQGWEEFDEKVDRIVSIGAFEHFRRERYEDFFATAYRVLPDDGSMLLHTITMIDRDELDRLGLPLTLRMLRFVKFIVTEIFPGGQLPNMPMVEEHAAKAGFNLARRQEIGPHYVKTLQLWAQALEAHREQAIAAQSQEVYDRYIQYLTGCVGLFRDGYTSVYQFTLQK